MYPDHSVCTAVKLGIVVGVITASSQWDSHVPVLGAAKSSQPQKSQPIQIDFTLEHSPSPPRFTGFFLWYNQLSKQF